MTSAQPFEGTVRVERVLSRLPLGCIFTSLRDDGARIRVKFTGQCTELLPGDAVALIGTLRSYRGRFGESVPQVDCTDLRPAIECGQLLTPWLQRLPNIGEVRARRLVDAYGEQLNEVLSDVSRLAEVATVLEPGRPALAARIAAQVYGTMTSRAGADRVRAAEVSFHTELEKLGITDVRMASRLWRLMAGADAVERLERNPYLVAAMMDWKAADKVGLRLLRRVEPGVDLASHPKRLLGAMSSVWRELLSRGDTASSEERLRSLLARRDVEPTQTLAIAVEAGAARRCGGLFRAPGAAWLEDQVALQLLEISTAQPTLHVPRGEQLQQVVTLAEHSAGLDLTEEQHATVMRLLSLPLGILQGGAGVGKTTVMRVLCTAWEGLGGNVAMAALAGKAALALSRGASSPKRPRLAYTVARLIGMLERSASLGPQLPKVTPGSNVSMNEHTLLVIDEAGMMDTPSLHRLLKLLPTGVRVLLVGDDGQLPPVGIGKVFHDLVAEGAAVCRLTRVMRQAAGSDIPLVAAQVRSGETPSLEQWAGQQKGVYRICSDELEAAQRELRVQGELMVIAARKTSVQRINESEAMLAHRTRTTVRLGPLATVAVGDPVVMTVNRYQEGLFNGLLGVVTTASETETAVLWDGEGSPRFLSPDAQADIELAYAITCHKAQGSSAEAVIALVEDSALVTREWLYTAITRARQLALLVCDQDNVSDAIARRTSRTTGFELRLWGENVA